MKIYHKFIYLSLLFIPSLSFTQVVINEYSCSNISGPTDGSGRREDWIELYNKTASPVNLAGYYMSDKKNDFQKWQFPAGISIPANGRIVVWASGRDSILPGSEPHTNFKLTQTQSSEWIILANPSGTLVDSIKVKPAQQDHSRGRTTDGANTWSVFITPTPNAANTGAKKEYAKRPVFSQAAGFFTSSVSLTLTTSEPNTTIYYTTNGSTPTTGSTLYAGAIAISATTVVRARAFSGDPDVPASFIETNTYFINANHTVPVVSVCGDQIATLLGGNSGLQPQGHFEFFDRNKTLKDEALGQYNKHGNDSWAYQQRGFDYVVRDQYGYNYAINDKLFPNKDRKSFQRLIFKPAANDNYPFAPGQGAHIRDAYVHAISQIAELRVDERTNDACVMYVNGQYWGVYETREKVDDDDFLDYYYNQYERHPDSPYYIQFLKTWGGTWAEYGGAQATADWNTFKNWVGATNMALMPNYDSLRKVYNVGSLIDYIVLNSYVVCSDWLNWNTAWWRGLNPNGDKRKWRYVLWDMDATFGHYIDYTGVGNKGPNADPCKPEALNDPGGQGHIPILNKLLQNDTFKQEYISRFIDLSNTTFSCTSMLHILDSMITQIDPEMQGQITKWGGTYNGWQNNVTSLRNWISARCDSLAKGLKSCYNLKGPYDFVVDVQPANAGKVKVNSIWAPVYPWTAKYYGNLDIIFQAKANSGYVFDHWTFDNHTPAPNDTTIIVKIKCDTTDNVTAHFIAIENITPEDSLFSGELAIPTAFSPNGDGFNDLFRLLGGKGVQEVELSIFNRWGERVFHTTDLRGAWDGTYKGKLQNSGVFAYTLKAVFTNGEVLNKKGNITMLK